jgi:hypothetical protein
MDVNDMHTYAVIGFKISGDLRKEQSRVRFTIAKEVKRTGKRIEFPTAECIMYGECDYKENADMTQKLMRVIDELMLYIEGKGALKGQLPLF